MNRAYLLTGGNIGDRIHHLAQALQLVNERCGRVVNTSALYETAAWGKTDQAPFLNQALELETELGAFELMDTLLMIEKSMGRSRDEKYGARTIDIDILFFNEDVINTSFLKIPHPELHNRRFVLEPMADIAPGLVHPVFMKTIRELADLCPDKLPVKKLY